MNYSNHTCCQTDEKKLYLWKKTFFFVPKLEMINMPPHEINLYQWSLSEVPFFEVHRSRRQYEVHVPLDHTPCSKLEPSNIEPIERDQLWNIKELKHENQSNFNECWLWVERHNDRIEKTNHRTSYSASCSSRSLQLHRVLLLIISGPKSFRRYRYLILS